MAVINDDSLKPIKCQCCGKMFVPRDRKVKYCSPDCGKKGAFEVNQIYRCKNKEKIRQRTNRRYRKLHPLRKCLICKGELESNHQKYCLDCLIKNYVHAEYGKKRTLVKYTAQSGLG